MAARRFQGCGERIGLVLALCVLSTLGAHAQDRDKSIELDTSSGPHVFSVEVMRTEAEREQGLMFRKSMAQDHGMLFDFETDQPLMFWMKNTYIPLDMVFIGSDGRVVSIARNAKPMDETVIPSKGPAAGVLELNAGAADKIGLKIGDAAKSPVFHNAAK